MKLTICTIRDEIAGGTLGLKTFTNDAVAIRDFKNVVKVNHADFDLLKVGEYDTETGLISAAPSPIVLMQGLELVSKAE